VKKAALELIKIAMGAAPEQEVEEED